MPLLTPINNRCLDCDDLVGLSERQELAMDGNENCRRRCGSCILKLDRQLGKAAWQAQKLQAEPEATNGQ